MIRSALGFVAKRASISRPAVASMSSAPSSLSPEEMAVLHHGQRPRYRDLPKFKSPRKRASKLLEDLQNEAVQKSKAEKPAVWETNFRVGDAIELELGRTPDQVEKIRGVVLGIYKKKMDECVLLRDVVFGQPIERRIRLHSPLLQSLKLLEENFVYKGKRKVKRAKLYYLRDRNPLDCRVTKW